MIMYIKKRKFIKNQLILFVYNFWHEHKTIVNLKYNYIMNINTKKRSNEIIFILAKYCNTGL